MTRIELLAVGAVGAVTAAMILGSSVVFASSPSAVDGGTGADQTTVTTDQPLVPTRRGGGGGAIHLKK